MTKKEHIQRSENNSKGFAILRIAFGIVWAIDAFFKWNPSFISDFKDTVSGAMGNQPFFVKAWIHFWLYIISFNAHHFAIITAITETIIAIGLTFGIFTRYVIYLGIIFSLLIWTTAEGFGGPYNGTSTDIGAAIIYVFVFIALFLGKSWGMYSWDARKRKK